MASVGNAVELSTRTSGKRLTGFTGKTKQSTSRKWSAIVISVSGVIGSCAFAIGHHIFYSTLNNTAVGSTERQQWALRIGTFFALAVGTCLRLAITSAYIQYIWLKFKNARVSLAHVDDAFNALSSILSLVNPQFFKKLPLAALAGLICWYVHNIQPTEALKSSERCQVHICDNTVSPSNFVCH
ncbi:hypothetical protein M501DRAFT_934460 [Patellaria atrata CBS 101060]|uniref:Uncharacterized protein n=1 Tax=Patellaria atrata CBS 101060 TaxID=1346257 RepID=A0A9P4S9A3_9PEZI|nr:hypothetical protein M501DRAFT_934460 [Patellaria atrata CBS 101060]